MSAGAERIERRRVRSLSVPWKGGSIEERGVLRQPRKGGARLAQVSTSGGFNSTNLVLLVKAASSSGIDNTSGLCSCSSPALVAIKTNT
ncbi:hypothetical protein RRG08_008590 [Elysia crispata]|uniref:Uncharacterized protein n=1 Tax=Elysia crispata TaxID=231223 RepID=A0AAE1EBR9_9GAST|nr:hypothetical protein RRG08_008590 [Elysia crispata]